VEPSNNKYDASEIKILRGLEPVRERPGMYIGSTSKTGLNHMVYEIVDNAIDEFINGYCNEISVVINEDDTVEVTDNGRGIPVDIHPEENKSTLEVVLTVLHAGGKFDKKAYKVSGGLHGVGASVVNGLSDFFEVKVFKEGKIYYQKYRKGIPEEPVKVIGKTDKTGTYIKFKPDAQIFDDGDVEVESQVIETRLKEIALLNPALTINFSDKKRGKTEVFHFKGGIEEFLDITIKKRKKVSISPYICMSGIYNYNETDPEMQIELAFTYTNSDENVMISFVNNIRTIDGGEHESGFKLALTRIMNDYARKLNVLKEKDQNFTGDDVREGVCAILHIKMSNPVYEGQTKGKLASKYAREAVNQVINEKLTLYLDSHQKEAKSILERIQEASKKRLAAKKARESVKRKSVFESSTLPGKLADCISKDLRNSEIFIVEGDSAGGNAKQARDRNFQAILPLRGKIINAEKTDILKLVKSDSVMNIVTALGTGMGEEFNIEKLRYGKVIVMTDADVDGAHITTLLLTLFYRYMRPLIDEGRVYIAQPPLYRYEVDKEHFYLYSDNELNVYKEKFKGKKFKLQRYKGLGEMNPDQLWETTMQVESRKLLKIKIEDLEIVDETIDILMGDDPSLRRTFIEQNAHKVKELDI